MENSREILEQRWVCLGAEVGFNLISGRDYRGGCTNHIRKSSGALKL